MNPKSNIPEKIVTVTKVYKPNEPQVETEFTSPSAIKGLPGRQRDTCYNIKEGYPDEA